VMICPKPVAVEDEESSLTPKDFELHQNYPNPFNNETIIKFNLRKPAEVSLTIYNILGQKVRTLVEGRSNAGSQTLSWDGKDDKGNDLSSGIYFYRLKAGELTETKRLVLLK
jgi:flagellar hook assembly protein FlgD